MIRYDPLFIGIDISKFKHDVAILNENKVHVIKPFIIQENRSGYQYLLNQLQYLREKFQTRTFYIGMESTADYWKNLYYFLKEQSDDFEVIVINPVQTKAYAKAELRRAKTDPVNAKDIAQYLVEKKPKSSTDCLPLFYHIRDVDTQIRLLRKQQSMSVNKLRIELTKVAPEIEHDVRKIDGSQILSVLTVYPTAEDIANATLTQLACIRYGKRQWQLPNSFVNRIKSLAHNSIAHKSGPGAGYVVQSLIRNIFFCQQEIQLLKKQLKLLYEHVSPTDSLLTSITGISKETAIVLEAYIGDVNRFPDAKKIVAYFGMNPTVNLSGKRIKRKSYLEKKGSGVVRHKLYMATLNMIQRKEKPIYEYYERLVASDKEKLVAIGAAMRKLLVIIYTLLKKNEKFDPHKFVNS